MIHFLGKSGLGFILFFALAASTLPQEKEKKAAKAFGEEQSRKALEILKTFDPSAFISREEKDTFNAEEARETLLEGKKALLIPPFLERQKREDLDVEKVIQDAFTHEQKMKNRQELMDRFAQELEALQAEENRHPEAFPAAITKLSIFGEIKKNLEDTHCSQPHLAQIFKGVCHQCNRSVLENTLYDCCEGMKGMATQVRLAKCTAEEIVLHSLREEGKCHYVGSYNHRVIRVKTEKVNVFCCFPSKLARIFQEQGRGLLKKSWGTPKQPDCGGLKANEITRLDFSKMDLREAFDKRLGETGDFEKKLSTFKKKMQEAKLNTSED